MQNCPYMKWLLNLQQRWCVDVIIDWPFVDFIVCINLGEVASERVLGTKMAIFKWDYDMNYKYEKLWISIILLCIDSMHVI